MQTSSIIALVISSSTHILGILTLLANIFIVFVILGFIFKKLKIEIGNYALLLAFLIALASVSGSLFFSEIAGYTPCVLCWWQRVFMYPQLILLGVALVRKKQDAADYAIPLSIIGGIIAAYHYYGQMFNASALPCGVIGLTPSCSQRFFVEFGYITIPFMSFTSFILLIVFLSLSKKQNS